MLDMNFRGQLTQERKKPGLTLKRKKNNLLVKKQHFFAEAASILPSFFLFAAYPNN